MMTSDPQRFSLRREGSDVLVATGELDMATVPELREELADSSIMAIDLSATSFIDSSALSVLVEAHRQRESAGGLAVRAPSRAVRRALEVTGLDQYLPVGPEP